MSSNHSFVKNMLDVSFSKIWSLLDWKCKLQGKYYYHIYSSSSKRYSYYDNKTDKTNNLSIRIWLCEVCEKND